MPRGIRSRTLGLALAGLLCCGGTLRAQVQLGSETQLGLNGSISTGYTGIMTNVGPDSHGLSYGGTGDFDGFFHSPQFLSFDVAPFFNQSRANSNYQSITDASGVSASANLFSGSQFPGYINFSKIYNSESNYAVPGLANYVTDGNTETFGLGWGAHFKSLPSFTLGYQQGNSDYSLYGTQQDSVSDYHSFYGNANYVVDGFYLSGGIRYSNSSAVLPEIGSEETEEKSDSDLTTYTFNMTRSLPLAGNTWVNFARSSATYDALGESTSETTDTVTGGVALKPTERLTTQVSADYDDNLAGYIIQQVAGTGAIVPAPTTEAPSHSWGLVGSAQYTIFQGLYVAGTFSQRQQLFLGEMYDSTAFGGSVNYGHGFLGGQFSAGLNINHNSYSSDDGSMLGLLSNAVYIRRFGTWGFTTSFNYSRNVQTILIAYTSSGYSYSGSANRRIHRLTLTLGANGSKTLLSQALAPTYFTQNYTMGLSGRWLGAGGSYSRSNGSGLLTPAGISTLPPGLPPTILSTVLYGGTTYSASVGSTPMQGLTITGSFINSRSNTQNGTLSSNNKTEQAYAYLNYKFRKVYFNAGYSRLLQGFSTSGLAPTLVSTYYAGISRWFKAF